MQTPRSAVEVHSKQTTHYTPSEVIDVLLTSIGVLIALSLLLVVALIITGAR